MFIYDIYFLIFKFFEYFFYIIKWCLNKKLNELFWNEVFVFINEFNVIKYIFCGENRERYCFEREINLMREIEFGVIW